MKLYPDKDYISKRLKRQEGWLDMKPKSKREMLFVAEQFRRYLTLEMAKFFDSLIHEGREHEAPSKEQLVGFHSISDELKQKLRR